MPRSPATRPSSGRFCANTTQSCSDVVQTRGAAPAIRFGTLKDLPTLAASAEYSSCYYNEMDWGEGSVWSYNLSLQHEIVRGTMVEIGYAGNQARHLHNVMPFNMAPPEW